MKTFYADVHQAHAPKTEFEGGRLVPAYETALRAELVIERVRKRGLGPVLSPLHFGQESLLRIHTPDFIYFLQSAFGQWREKYGAQAAEAFPSTWPGRAMRDTQPRDIEGLLGAYTFDMGTPIVAGTWTAARAAANVALSAAATIRSGERSAFALCRPPGHHATSDLYGGYCFLNNAAIAAQWFVDADMRVALLDVDGHHGNGTQTLFYDRDDVLFVSLHGDPRDTYPFFLGYADEKGTGAGEGFNLNLPLPLGTEWRAYRDALNVALERVRAHKADVLVVSLGLDTYEQDPLSPFRLKRDNYLKLGEALAEARLPTLFVMEGGYALDALGDITVNVLEGFEEA